MHMLLGCLIRSIEYQQNLLALDRGYIYIIKDVMFVCLSVPMFRMAGQTAGPIETKLDTRTHVHQGVFCQGQCQGHSCMRAGLTEVRNTWNATPSERCSHYVRTPAEVTPSERLRNAVELQLQ